ncbi:TBC1 domain family member 7-like [Uloborus diversus]|uniref:TBC1 domain family member 7-like n=1 Tax=Uloborus diversus TaxID=327109 RepID=UPI00240A7348|nr:TBC1 domain family member 7-like [Uloborus diversus]
MGEKVRNFRSSYYDKVGFRGVEEKKSLEILLNEKPIDKEKLSKFCVRVTLPSMYREYVWKVLLGVLPVNIESHDSVMQQRQEHYQELEASLRIMKKVEEDMPRSVVHALMFLLTEELILFDLPQQLESSHVRNLAAIASVFLELCSQEIDAYWLFKNFILFRRQAGIQFHILKEKLESILSKEDNKLIQHLRVVGALEALPLCSWFDRCFAKILHRTSLARILDKVIGGSFKVLSYVGAAIFLVRRHPLLAEEDRDQIVSLLEKIPEDTSDVVVNKALDLYYSR